eukprot:2846850-Ditylum_brightwellii.AAC.1
MHVVVPWKFLEIGKDAINVVLCKSCHREQITKGGGVGVGVGVVVGGGAIHTITVIIGYNM